MFKIIEFDGDYWHRNSSDVDSLKDVLYNFNGYDVLRIKESDYNTNSEKVVEKCLKFLNNQ